MSGHRHLYRALARKRLERVIAEQAACAHATRVLRRRDGPWRDLVCAVCGRMFRTEVWRAGRWLVYWEPTQ